MSADAAGFNPLGYHAGSVWPHDTGIAIIGLAATGHAGVAASFADGLVRVAPAFDDRLPELFGGTDARAGEPVLAYPDSCRPVAWSAEPRGDAPGDVGCWRPMCLAAACE